MIYDASGTLRYEEPESQRPWHLNNYWAWNTDDKFWVFDSDISRFLVFELADGSWIRRDAADSEQPPDELKRHVR
jgi:hypothetical protein